MKYIFFVSREPWSSFNSIYAYLKTKKKHPDEFLALYSDQKNMKTVERMLKVLHNTMKITLNLKKIKIPEDRLEEMESIITKEVREEDVIDITGARKLMILSLLKISGVKVNVVYLYLKDMRFSSLPYMARPIQSQELLEVLI